MSFNPDRAVMVDDDLESDELDSILPQMDAKMKKFRAQIIADAFKEWAASAKAERRQLVDTAMEKCAEMMEKERPLMVQAVATELRSSYDRLRTFTDKIAASHEKMEKTMKDGLSKASQPSLTRQMVAEEVATALAEFKASMATEQATKEAQEGRAMEEGNGAKPHEHMAAMIEEAIKRSMPKRGGWTFKVVRDRYNKIEDVLAMPAE